jgi:hypothetical protein
MGFLTYTADGRFSVVMADNGRTTLMPSGSIEEKARAFDTFKAYAGRLTDLGERLEGSFGREPALYLGRAVALLTVWGVLREGPSS